MIDDYGHHPRRDRGGAEGGARIRQRQGHRGGAAASLYPAQGPCSSSSRTCFNDADAVIVADVYPAGEAPIAGTDRDHLVTGPARAAIASVAPLESPERLAGH